MRDARRPTVPGQWFLRIVAVALTASSARARVENRTEFAPAEAWVAPVERPLRADLCLNGAWQFEPVDVPAGFQPVHGEPPPLPPPSGRWDAVPVKVPCPWNVNAWGTGPDAGPGTGHPPWPTSAYFPSYPRRWADVEMGWLRRTFRVPWADRRTIVHFEAVAGDCVVLVNGRPAGGHFDSYTPFELDVTDLLRPGDNTLLVGVRSHRLFDVRSAAYPKMRAPYPVGSSTERLCGIWQDVWLLGLSPVRVADVFVRPDLAGGELAVDVTVRNDTDAPATVTVGGVVRPWVVDAIDRGSVRTHLGTVALPYPFADQVVPAHGTATFHMRQPATLDPWTPATPTLYAVVVTVAKDGDTVDRQQTRFGWRQFTLRGPDLLLNGTKVQLVGDLLHPFGPFTLSPRYAWGWYTLVKAFGGNAVRLHGQPMPRFYLDLADAMGLCVLDETALFGSSVELDFEPPVAWQRFADHYDGLVLRDRNHPSVLGWSFGNELFAVFDLNHVGRADGDRWYRQLADLGLRARTLDSTRPWISCDGDGDLRGTLPVYSAHLGLGLPAADRLPDCGKPLMVGESGGSYYAKPAELAVFNGDAAFASYAGRNDALGIDLYDNIVHLAKPRLAYFSASETAWFGVEPLPFGYADLSRLPTADDGVWFTAPFADGKPGIQLEHLPPYVATVNPGWDPALPLYRPLGMFEAERAAVAGRPCRWDHRDVSPPPSPPAPPTIDRVAFVGDRTGPLGRRLVDWGVPLVDGAASFTIVDGDTAADAVPTSGTRLVLLNRRVPAGLDVTLTDRQSTALVADPTDPWTAPFTAASLYFAEQPVVDRRILTHGLAGPAVDHGRVLLRAAEVDWSQFNDLPEVAKCGATLLDARLRKGSGAALVRTADGLALCSIDYRAATPAADAMWRQLLANMGVRLGAAHRSATPALDDQGALAAAEVDGRPAHYADHDRFVFDRAGTVVVRFWVRSPRALDDVLAGGPDVPGFDLTCYAADAAELSLNDHVVQPSRSEPADYRTLAVYAALPLRRGWNELTFRVTAAHVDREKPPTLAVRVRSDDAAFMATVESSSSEPAKGGE